MNFKLCHTCKYEHSRLCCSGCEQDNDEYVQAEWFTKKEVEIRADERLKVIDELSVYVLNSCKDVKRKEDITIDNDFDFYASELLEMLELLKEQEGRKIK